MADKPKYDKGIAACTSLRELYLLAVRRNYKNPEYWAKKRWEGRKRRKPREWPKPEYKNYYEPKED